MVGRDGDQPLSAARIDRSLNANGLSRYEQSRESQGVIRLRIVRKTATFAVITLFAINILNFYDRNVAGALVEPMRKEFHLSDTQVGLLGSAFIWLYAVIGVPLGKIADVWSRKKLLALGVTVWSTLTAFTYFASSYPMLMFARLGVGVGE